MPEILFDGSVKELNKVLTNLREEKDTDGWKISDLNRLQTCTLRKATKKLGQALELLRQVREDVVLLGIPGKENKPPVEFYTIHDMAEMCGRSKAALMKLIERGILPDSNFRTTSVTITKGERAGTTVEGTRLYSKDILAPKLVEIFKGITQGKQITYEQRVALMEAFAFEKNYYQNEY